MPPSTASFLGLGSYLPGIAKPVASRPHQHQQFPHHLLLAAAAAHCRPAHHGHQPYLTGMGFFVFILLFCELSLVTTPGGPVNGPGGPNGGPQQTTVFPLPGAFPWAHSGRGKPRRGMMRRAVFSDLQRKGLERRFQIQKYISKPDRKKLAEKLGLKDSQVRVFQFCIIALDFCS